MVGLKQWVRDVLLILLLTHALELAIPFGQSRRYVRIGAGLIVLLALLQPLLTLLRSDFDAVLVQAADTSVIEREIEARLGLVQQAQAEAASRVGERLGEETVVSIAAAHGLTVSDVQWTRAGRVVIWLADDRSGAVPALAGWEEGQFVHDVSAALGVSAAHVDVRWRRGEEGSR